MKINSCTAMLIKRERYKIITTLMNSNKFTEFDMKSKNSDLKIKKPKKLKHLSFQDF